MIRLHLLDLLTNAHIQAPNKHHIELQRITIARQSQMAIFQHPNSRLTFPPLKLGTNPRLRTDCGIRETAWSRLGSPVEFSVWIEVDNQSPKQLLSHILNPQTHAAHRAWLPFTLDLSA